MRRHFGSQKRTKEDRARDQAPLTVCMHVRGVARTDGRVLREASALVAEGYAVTIVDVEDQLTRPPEEDLDGIHVKHLLKPHWLIPTRSWRRIARSAEKFLVSSITMARMRADVYHAHDVNALPATYISALLHRKPLIFDAHELPLYELDRSRHTMLRALLARVVRHIVTYCAGVITVSPPIAEEIRARYHARAVTLVRNIPAYQEVPRSDHLRRSLGLDADARIALYQGNIQADRGLDRLVHAAAFLDPGHVIVLMGKDVAGNRARLEALALQEGVAERLKIIPPVPYAELLAWTASAALGLIVYPPGYSLNVQWCLPNKLFEYLMAGLPVLTSPLEAVADLLHTYDVGDVVDSLEPGKIAAAINTMLANSATLARFRQNALAAARSDLSWEKERQHLLNLYQNIACPAWRQHCSAEPVASISTGEQDAHSLHL